MYNSAGAMSSQDLNAQMEIRLNETAQECGKNCLRKYDKVYRLYTTMERDILQSFCEDEGIDQDEFAQHAMQKFQAQMGED